MKRRRNFTAKPVPAKIRKTPRSAGEGLYAYPKTLRYPIGDLYHARTALVYILSPNNAKSRKTVAKAVQKAYPTYNWGAWWNKEKKRGVPAWSTLVGAKKSNPRKSDLYMIFSTDEGGVGLGDRYWGSVPKDKVKEFIKEISREQDIPTRYFISSKVIQPTRTKSNPRLSFSDLQIGDSFESNGSTWVKKSSRTAYIFGMPHRWFYFSKSDPIFSTRKEADEYERSQPTIYLNPRRRNFVSSHRKAHSYSLKGYFPSKKLLLQAEDILDNIAFGNHNWSEHRSSGNFEYSFSPAKVKKAEKVIAQFGGEIVSKVAYDDSGNEVIPPDRRNPRKNSPMTQHLLKNSRSSGRHTLKLTNSQLNALGRITSVSQGGENRMPTRVIDAITSHNTVHLSKAQAESIYKALNTIKTQSFFIEPRDRRSVDAVLNKLEKIIGRSNPHCKPNPRRRNSNALSVTELKQIRTGLVLARKAMKNHYKSINAESSGQFNYSTDPELWQPTTNEIINASFKGKDPVEKVVVEMLGVSRGVMFQKGEIKFNIDMSATVNTYGLVSPIKVRVEDPYSYTVLDEYFFDPYTGKKQKRKSNPRRRGRR